MKNSVPPRLIREGRKLRILDQRKIPKKIEYITVTDAGGTAKAIKDMVLRGAPLIGCAAAYGFFLGIAEDGAETQRGLFSRARKISNILKSARPTAVALFYAVDRMNAALENFVSERGFSKRLKKDLVSALAKEAEKIAKEDEDSDLAIAENGEKLLRANSKIITVCNAGALATMGVGTAIGVITRAAAKGKISMAYACETRPYLQGARLTAWEFHTGKIPHRIICDNMAGYVMANEKIDAVIVGADRIAANGDTANKIGTYQLAVLARYHKIPFYVAAPLSTIDFSLENGSLIKIEQRPEKEVLFMKGIPISHEKARALHPAFDITPRGLIDAIITEKGIIKKPSTAAMRKRAKAAR